MAERTTRCVFAMPLAGDEVARESNRSVSFVQLARFFSDRVARVCAVELQRFERKRKRTSFAGIKPERFSVAFAVADCECQLVTQSLAQAECVWIGHAVADTLTDGYSESLADAIADPVAHAHADAVTDTLADSNADAVSDSESHARPADGKPERADLHQHRRAIRADVHGDRSRR